MTYEQVFAYLGVCVLVSVCVFMDIYMYTCSSVIMSVCFSSHFHVASR